MGSEFAVYNSLSLNISGCVVHFMLVLSVVTGKSDIVIIPQACSRYITHACTAFKLQLSTKNDSSYPLQLLHLNLLVQCVKETEGSSLVQVHAWKAPI